MDEMDVRMTRWAMTPDSLYKKTAISLLKQGSYTKQQLLTKMMSELSPYPGEYDEEETRMLTWLDKEIEKKTFTMCGDWMAYYKPEWEKLKFDDLLIDNAFMHLHNELIAKAKIKAKSNGMTCSGTCGEFNEFAEPNQKNGTFICYGCRSR